MSLDAYLQICEAQNQEPDENILLAYREEDFPIELQYAFYIYSMLPTIFHGMGDAYAGKDPSSLEALLRIFDVTNIRAVTELIMHINYLETDQVNKQIKREREKSQKSAKSGKGK